MQKKQKIVKKLFSREKEVIRSSKKVLRPWIMQYKWFSAEFAKKHTFARDPSLDWMTHYGSYKDTEHALQQLNKELRSFKWIAQQYNDRASRLYNKNTKEILDLIVEDNKVKIKTD